MPDNVDLEAIRQQVGAAFQQIGRDLEAVNKKAKDATGSGGGFSSLNIAITNMTKNMLGPLGLAAGFYAVTKALTDFADSRLKLQLFSTDVGFTTGMLVGMRKAVFEAGKEMADADRIAGAIGGTLQDLRLKRHGSAIYQDLSQLGQTDWANQLLATVDRGDFNRALNMILEKWETAGPRFRLAMAAAFHLSPSDIDAALHSQEQLNIRGQEIADRYASQVRKYRQLFTESWQYAAGGVLEGVGVALQYIDDAKKRIDAAEANKTKPADKQQPTADPSSDKMQRYWDYWKEIERSWGLGPGGKSLLPNAAAAFPPAGSATTPPSDGGATFDERFGKATDFSSRNRLQQLISAGLDKYQAGVDWLNASANVPGLPEKNKSILYKFHENIKPPDVESILDQMIPVNPLLFLKHAAQQYTRGNQANFADRFSAIWGDRTSDFSARQKADDLITIETESSNTLRDIRDLLLGVGGGGNSGGSIGGGRRMLGRRLGIDTGGGGGELGGKADVADVSNLKGNDALAEQRASRIAEINNDPELKENVLKMLALEESRGVPRTAAMEALLNRSVMVGNTIKQELFSGFYGPINNGGLRRPLGAGSRATSQAAFDAAARGSNIIEGRNDQGSYGDPNASGPGRIRVPGTTGIYNFWQGTRGGHFYSHAESAAFAAEQNRLAMDRAQSPSQQSRDANMNATIDFRNMPSWVKSSVDSNGVFKNLKVSRSTPQDGRADSGQTGYNPWGYE